MAFDGLREFVSKLEKENELVRITVPVDPELEITEITERVVKSRGKALLFENNGSQFPLLINTFGAENRMCMAIGRSDLEEAGRELQSLFGNISSSGKGLFSKLKMIPEMISMASLIPKRVGGRGKCQEIVLPKPDLSILPVLKCWPFDGGPFITLPVVHTNNPVTGEVNAGMYRMQIFDNITTGMHWHRHKTGANHFEVWKKEGKQMPVVVTLGGDPVYTYAATAPLPEGIDEYLLAGFLRKKRVKMVKALTQDLYIPEDVDFVIEGYIDTTEDLAWEGPFGDHTGFYSLADWYPKFHVTAITHRKDAIYPTTIVGIPPQEDTIIGKATERLFLYPIKLTLQPDIIDIHMPAAGVAHNLVLVKIDKKYPGQGLKVINSLFGAGQMMFSKFIIVLDGDIDIFDYREVMKRALENICIPDDLMITRGPLDVLDHSSDKFSFGGKMGMDATTKLPEEISSKSTSGRTFDKSTLIDFVRSLKGVSGHRIEVNQSGSILFLTIDYKSEIRSLLKMRAHELKIDWIFLLDKGVDENDIDLISWQILSNTDPIRDIEFFATTIIVDSTAKNRQDFPRDWPNVVASSTETIKRVDKIWESLKIGVFEKSPSLKYMSMLFQGEAKATRKGDQSNPSSVG